MLPSIRKIIYAISTNTSIGALFVAGLLPGSLLTAMLCVVTWYLARKRNYPRMTKASWFETWHAFRESIWGLMLVVIIIGGIYSGLFTATEAAAMAAVYSFFISVFVYKALKFKDVPRVLLRAANTSAMLLYIVTNAVLFSFVLSNENIPSALADWITAQDLGWVGFLLLVNILLLLAGNFMEPTSIILIMAPILAPAAKRLGIDLVHFGIVIDVNMGSRSLPSAGWPQPLCCIDDRGHAHYRSGHGRHAVAAHHVGVPGNCDLLARSNTLAPDSARYALGSIWQSCDCRKSHSPRPCVPL
jgi:C4-dicarboxylate transporter DctM subunit